VKFRQILIKRFKIGEKKKMNLTKICNLQFKISICEKSAKNAKTLTNFAEILNLERCKGVQNL